jgi:hypothetical protein
LGNSYGGADQSKIQPLPIRAPYRGNGGECTWVKVHAYIPLHCPYRVPESVVAESCFDRLPRTNSPILRYALHSLQLKGIRRAEKNFSFPTPTRYEELGEYGVLQYTNDISSNENAVELSGRLKPHTPPVPHIL